MLLARKINITADSSLNISLDIWMLLVNTAISHVHWKWWHLRMKWIVIWAFMSVDLWQIEFVSPFLSGTVSFIHYTCGCKSFRRNWSKMEILNSSSHIYIIIYMWGFQMEIEVSINQCKSLCYCKWAWCNTQNLWYTLLFM